MARQHVAACAALALAVAALGWPVLSGGDVLMPPAELAYEAGRAELGIEPGTEVVDDVGSDTLEEILPWKIVVDRRLRGGDVPLWNPHAGTGAPLLANNQSMVFSPLTWLFLWASPSRALSLGTLLMLAAGACAAYALLRLWGARFASAVASGAFVVWSSYTAEPANLWMLEHTNLGPRNWVLVALAAAAWALAAPGAGRVAIAALAVGALLTSGNLQFAYAALLMLSAYATGVAIERRSPPALAWGAAIVLLGLGIGAVQVLPTAELIRLAGRSFELDVVLDTTARPLDVQLQWVLWTSGAGGVALALAGGLQRRWIPASCLALCAGAILATSGGLVYRVLYAVVPRFDAFNLDTNLHYVPFSVASPLLVGFGIERVLAWQHPLRRWAAVALGLLVLVPGIELHARGAYRDYVLSPPPEDAPELPCVEALSGEGRIVRYRSDALPPNVPIGLGLDDVQVYDSFLLERYSRYVEALEPGVRQEHPISQRMLAIRGRASLDSPLLDLLGATKILSGVRLDAWTATVAGGKPAPPPPPGLGRFRLAAGDPDGWCLSPGRKGWWVYENPGALPRVFLVPGARAYGTVEEVLDAARAPGFDPRGCVLIEGPLPEGVAPGACDGGRAAGSIAIARDGGDELELSVESGAPAFAVIADAYAPGWEAEVDGVPAPVVPAYHLFRAVPVPAGRHTVRLVYRPASYRAGAALSLASLALVAAMMLARRGRRR